MSYHCNGRAQERKSQCGYTPQIFKANSAMLKSNAAVDSSKSLNNFIKPPTEIATSTRFHMPTRVTSSQPAFNIPPKRKSNHNDIDSQSTTESDIEDFQNVPSKRAKQEPEKFNMHKKEKNPFSKPQILKKPKREDAFHEVDDSDVFKEASQPFNRLKIPKKNKQETKSAEEKREEHENEKLVNSLHRAQKQHEYNADKKKCPYCSEILHPLNDVLSDALKKIQEKDEKHKKIELKLLEKENSNSSFTKPTHLIRKRQVPWDEKDAFCRLHNIELVIKPNGIEDGYPTEIDFDEVEKRVNRFDVELKDIISNKIQSDYRDIAEKAYKDEGVTKARSAISVMSRFQKSLPGYYGPKGSAIILNALTKIYLKSGYLNKHLVSPQLPLEFLQQVLVPEAGYRLIRQDLIRKDAFGPKLNERAKKIMLESIEYGNAIFPVEDADIADTNIEKPLHISFGKEDENADFLSDS